MHGNHLNLIIAVLIEVAIVIVLSRAIGLLFQRIQQPLVIGEIVAGIALGPSLLGSISPGLMNAIFPPETLPILNVLSQIGLIFFMFLIGLELNPKYLQGQLKSAILISNAGIILPFILGGLVAIPLYPLLPEPLVGFLPFLLFLGAAMSITAFPVLARIVIENNLQGTRLGTLALTCAAVDDITAWCLLAVAIAATRSNSLWDAVPTILEAIAYSAFMLVIARRWLRKLAHHYDRVGRVSQLLLASIYVLVIISSLITEAIGIHLIFGAFLVGAIMPKNEEFTREIAIKTEDFVLIFLLPIFFAYSGLRTQIGLLDSIALWSLCGLVLAAAVAGKFIGATGAARFCHIPLRESIALGWLMNARGLTELIVLNIGLSLKVISPAIFAMLTIMALVTTFMTSPLLRWTISDRRSRHLKPSSTSDRPKVTAGYRILMPVANPVIQRGLLQVTAALAAGPSAQDDVIVYPFSAIEPQELYAFESIPEEVDRQIANRLQTLRDLAQTLEPATVRSRIYPLAFTSSDVVQEVMRFLATHGAELVVMGWHRSTFLTNRLGGRVGQILNSVPTDVAVWVEKGRAWPLERLLVPYSGTVHDDLALELALRLLINDAQRRLSVLRVSVPGQGAVELSYEIRSLLDRLPSSLRDRLTFSSSSAAEPMQVLIEASAQFDLTLVGTSHEWGLERQTLGRYADELTQHCQSSLLIARRYTRTIAHLQPIADAAVAPSVAEPAHTESP
jgi:Kef-type K+ transport system membrane component KefB/nucleotide-binding universal stress UspA family protein